MKKLSKIALTLGTIIIVCVLYLLINMGINRRDSIIEVVEPTCTEEGYTIFLNKKTNTRYADNYISALGHEYIDNRIVKTANGIKIGIKELICSRCNETKNLYYTDDNSIPKLCLEGSLEHISKNKSVTLKCQYIDKDNEFSSYVSLKYQGHSSLVYPKKNFTIKFFEDEDCDKKLKLSFKDWKPESKYILKANYIDPSYCRNIVCANIWSDIVKSRSSINPNLNDLSNYGAVDGFPIALYIDGNYYGLYTLNLHKDDDLFNIVDGEKQAIAIINQESLPESLFMDSSSFLETSDWEIEACGTENNDWAKKSLNNLILFIKSSDIQTFKKEIGNYLDVDAAIDYLISMYSLGLTTNYSKDLVLVTYDSKIWIPSLYDMENAFGLSEDGTSYFDAKYFMPVYSNNSFSSNTGSLLWDKLLVSYFDEIKLRYNVLRDNELSFSNIVDRIEEYMRLIPNDYREEDRKIYYDMPDIGVDYIEQMKEYVANSLSLLDDFFGRSQNEE